MNPPVNSEIRIMKPLEDGFAMMKRILFQPFDLTKWLVIGFAAFLSGHFSGGAGFSPPINFQGRHSSWSHRSDMSGINFHQYPPVVLALVCGAIIFFLVVILVLMWVKARGIFVFTDCIVRQRAAIKDPWREYRREGNSLFLFYLAMAAAIFAFVAMITGICFLFAAIIHLSRGQQLFEWIGLGVFGFGAYFVVVIILALITYFVPMVMYRRRCRAIEAFRAVLHLFWTDPGAFALFGLCGMILFIGWIITAAIITCATCCMALLPYVGTVIMLPVFVWLRSFGLLFLRQFGPEWDVWPAVAPVPPPLPPEPASTV
jgi:hypothetical protein